MKIKDIKSIDQATEKDLLIYILSTQLQILRRLDLIDEERKNSSHFDSTKEFVSKIDSFHDRINEYLASDDDTALMDH